MASGIHFSQMMCNDSVTYYTASEFLRKKHYFQISHSASQATEKTMATALWANPCGPFLFGYARFTYLFIKKSKEG